MGFICKRNIFIALIFIGILVVIIFAYSSSNDSKLSWGSINPKILFGQKEFNLEAQRDGPSLIDLTVVEGHTQNVTQSEWFNVTLESCCLTGSCGEVNVSLDPEVKEGTTTYTKYSYTTEDTKTGQKTAVISGRQQFAQDHGIWKRVEDMPSLLGTDYKYSVLKNDKDLTITIIDYNWTSITAKFETVEKNYDTKIPIFILTKNETACGVDKLTNKINPCTEEEKYILTEVEQKTDITLSAISKSSTQTFDIEHGQALKFGDASEIVVFGDGDVIEDGYIQYDGGYSRDDTGDSMYIGETSGNFLYRSYVNWNISSIPENSIIEDVYINISISSSTGTATTDFSKIDTFYPSDHAALYAEAHNDTIYVDDSTIFRSTGWKEIDLGTDADADLEAQLADTWFAVGIYAPETSFGPPPVFINTDDGTSEPELHVTYTVPASKGLVDTTVGADPFWTTSNNPNTTTIGAGECINTTFEVNATGSVNSTFEFFGYNNLTSDLSVSNFSIKWNITITDRPLSYLTITPVEGHTQNVTQYEWFNVTTETCCFNEDCGQVDITLDPEGQSTYYPNSTGSALYYCSDGTDPPSTLKCDTFTLEDSTDTDKASADDGTDYEATVGAYFNNGGVGNFSLDESSASIESLNFTVKGQCVGPSCDSMYIYLWNLTSRAWDNAVASPGYSVENYMNIYVDYEGASTDYVDSNSYVLALAIMGSGPMQGNYIDFMKLEVTAETGGTVKSEIISTVEGTIPFWTQSDNPSGINLTKDECVNVTFEVNATGDTGVTHSFWAYVNKTTDNARSNFTSKWNITTEAAGDAACTPTLDVDWEISDRQVCDGKEVTTGTGKISLLSGGTLYLINGANVSTTSLNILSSGDKLFVNYLSRFRIT